MPLTVFITGATDGIGLELARRHAREGARLVLGGRRDRGALDASLFTPARYCQADLAEPDAPARVLAHLAAEGIESLDLVIHNAAVASYGPIEADEPGLITAMVAVNLLAPIALTHALAPHLAKASGRVVFVSSIVADLPCADYAVYGASKAALDGFARSLGVEWQGRIRVQAVHPGAVRTGFHEKSGVPAALVASPRIPSAARVAAQIHTLAQGNARTPSVGFGSAVLRFIGRRAPRLLERALRRGKVKAAAANAARDGGRA